MKALSFLRRAEVDVPIEWELPKAPPVLQRLPPPLPRWTYEVHVENERTAVLAVTFAIAASSDEHHALLYGLAQRAHLGNRPEAPWDIHLEFCPPVGKQVCALRLTVDRRVRNDQVELLLACAALRTMAADAARSAR